MYTDEVYTNAYYKGLLICRLNTNDLHHILPRLTNKYANCIQMSTLKKVKLLCRLPTNEMSQIPLKRPN